MPSHEQDEKKKLEFTIAVIQQRWGTRAIAPANQRRQRSPTAISTSFPALDEALGIGGIPQRRITEIVGVATSGMATLALKIVAQAQGSQGGSGLGGQSVESDKPVVYLDIGKTFDPDYAHRCGVHVERIILVRPYSFAQSLEMLVDFVSGGYLPLIVFDMPLQIAGGQRQRLSTTTARLLGQLHHSASTLLFLTTLSLGNPGPVTYPPGSGLPHYAALRLQLRRERWLYRQRDVAGYAAQVLILKNKFGRAQRQVPIAITFDGVVQGDGT